MMADAYEYEFTEDEVESTGKEWWLEVEEGSILFQMTGSEFDSCLLVNLEKDPVMGFVVAKVATEDGSKEVRLSLKKFISNRNKFCEMFQEKTFSRTLFLGAFNNFKSSTDGKKKTYELDACIEVPPTKNVKESSTSSSCQIAEETSGPNQELDACIEVSPTKNVKESSTSSSCQLAAETSSSSHVMPAAEEEEDNCSPATLNKHKVADSIKVKVSLLQPPSKACQVRDIDSDHSKQLQEEMKRNPDSRYLKVLIHIPDKAPKDVDIGHINSGHYKLEVLGGNHTRLALQTMKSLPPTECLDAVVYAGLSRNQALCLGILHNEGHHMAKAMTFYNYVHLFRKIWTSIISTVQKPSNNERKRLKDTLSDMFRLPKKQVGSKFRHHIYLATLDNEVWTKVATFMEKWEQRQIPEQPPKPLSQFNTAILEKIGSREEMLSTLTQLVEKEVTWKDIRHRVENRRQETKPKPVGDLTGCHDEVLSLKAEIMTLKRKNSELELEVASLRQKMKKMQDTGKVTSTQSDEKKESKRFELDELSDGQWIGVLYNSKCFLGKVLDVGNGWVKAQFLTGRTKGRLNKRDIQQVKSKFIICKVRAVEENDGVYFLSKEEEQAMGERFQLYKETFL